MFNLPIRDRVCVACKQDFYENYGGRLVRVHDETGYSLSYMCKECIRKYSRKPATTKE